MTTIQGKKEKKDWTQDVVGLKFETDEEPSNMKAFILRLKRFIQGRCLKCGRKLVVWYPDIFCSGCDHKV